MPKSNYLDNAMLNAALCDTAYTSPATVYVALFTATPSASGGGTEVSGGAYARQSVAFSSPSGEAVTNSANVTFPVATANWGTVTSFAIFDASTSGNMLYYGNLTANVTINSGGQFQFANGGISISES